MGRKVFVSFLGTGNYVNCYYTINGTKSNPVRFIQEALIRDTCKYWGENDKIYIFCTKTAKNTNWYDNGHEKVYEEIECIGLETRLKNTPYFKMVEMHEIPEGMSEDELWGIFDAVYAHLEENDEVYFDVTHAFRAIPMFASVLLNYSQYLKSISIERIQYGAFEKLGPAFKVRQLPLDDRIAPVIDLTNIIRLQQYTDLASSFITTGRVKKIRTVINTDNSNSPAYLIQKSLSDFDDALMSNRLTQIKEGKCLKPFFEAKKRFEKGNDPEAIKIIIRKIYDKLEHCGFINKSSNQNVEAAIKWASEYKMLPQAYTLAQEHIITLILDNVKSILSKYDITSNKVKRCIISAACGMSDKDVKDRRFTGCLEKYQNLAIELLSLSLVDEIRPAYIRLGNNRNDINHAKNGQTFDRLANELNTIYDKCMNIIKEYATKPI